MSSNTTPVIPDRIRSMAGRLEQLDRWDCSNCGEVQVGQRSSLALCLDCEALAKEEMIRGLPKAEALKHSGVPLELRHEQLWLRDSWPRDSRPKSSEIDPLLWPKLFSPQPAASAPTLVTLAGSNGAGKSTRGVHLLHSLHQQGVRPLCWVSELDLAAEQEGFGVKSLYTKALEAGAAVIDEVGATRGRNSDVELAFNVILKLIDKRLNARRPTICTTHRPLSKEGAIKRGRPESESLEAIAPAIYDRMRTGLMLGLPNRSHRGQWAM